MLSCYGLQKARSLVVDCRITKAYSFAAWRTSQQRTKGSKWVSCFIKKIIQRFTVFKEFARAKRVVLRLGSIHYPLLQMSFVFPCLCLLPSDNLQARTWPLASKGGHKLEENAVNRMKPVQHCNLLLNIKYQAGVG